MDVSSDPAPASSVLDAIPPLLTLAGPVVLAEIGWMVMGVVDTIMVGPLGPAAIGAAGMGSSLFMALGIFGLGVLLGLDTLVSQAFGARRLEECRAWLRHGTALALMLTPALMAVGWGAMTLLPWLDLNPAVVPLLVPYLRILLLSTPPLLLYASFRRYLQGVGLVRPVMVALLSANIVNALGNWVLVYGHFGMPRLGVPGSAWATCLSRVYMATYLAIAIVQYHRRLGVQHAPSTPWSAARLRRLFGLGLPAASQVTLEVGVFAAVTALAGRLPSVALASHQIALNVASLTFMVPLGLASGGAIMVGQAVGRRDPGAAERAGWAALALGVAFMGLAAIVFLASPRALLRVFSRDEGVLATGTRLLAVAAVFQLFDGTQGVATGILRGLGDTRTPMITNLVGHWAVGLPIAYVSCFVLGWGVVGLWIGLSVGLIAVSLVLVRAWIGEVRRLRTGHWTPAHGEVPWH